MPVVSILKKQLWPSLGLPETFTREDFEELCFEFGIELDAVTSEVEMHIKNQRLNVTKPEEIQQLAKRLNLSAEPLYKIEIPANRYDLLSIEGLTRALNVYRGRQSVPQYRLTSPPKTDELAMVVDSSVKHIRGGLVACVLRNMTFTEENYASFIDLQEKLHQNICRKRTLVSIGTHDLDTIKGPFIYSAQKPEKIKFAPLNETKVMDGNALMTHLEHSHLKAYLSIIRDLPAYPVIHDKNGIVLSLPPIINGDHSKIKLTTRNVLIEVTATDLTKAQIVLDTVAALFSQYCSDSFTVEPVAIYQGSLTDRAPERYPKWNHLRHVTVSTREVNSYLGQSLTADQIARYLARMSLGPSLTVKGDLIDAELPPTRSDVLHACDLIEDVAIAFGYNKLGKTVPQTVTVGRQVPLNKFTDLLRLELAQHGYSECLTQSLCSKDEMYKFLNQPDDNSAVVIANPASQEFQVCRTNLLPGLLKSLSHNQALGLPRRVFEISDAMIKDPTADTGTRNKRMLCAMYANQSAGFEVMHGLLDRVMLALGVPAKFADENSPSRAKTPDQLTYHIEASDNATYLPGRGARIMYNGKEIGTLGVLHPIVLTSYVLPFPVATLQLDIELFV